MADLTFSAGFDDEQFVKGLEQLASVAKSKGSAVEKALLFTVKVDGKEAKSAFTSLSETAKKVRTEFDQLQDSAKIRVDVSQLPRAESAFAQFFKTIGAESRKAVADIDGMLRELDRFDIHGSRGLKEFIDQLKLVKSGAHEAEVALKQMQLARMGITALTPEQARLAREPYIGGNYHSAGNLAYSEAQIAAATGRRGRGDFSASPEEAARRQAVEARVAARREQAALEASLAGMEQRGVSLSGTPRTSISPYAAEAARRAELVRFQAEQKLAFQRTQTGITLDTPAYAAPGMAAGIYGVGSRTPQFGPGGFFPLQEIPYVSGSLGHSRYEAARQRDMYEGAPAAQSARAAEKRAAETANKIATVREQQANAIRLETAALHKLAKIEQAETTRRNRQIESYDQIELDSSAAEISATNPFVGQRPAGLSSTRRRRQWWQPARTGWGGHGPSRGFGRMQMGMIEAARGAEDFAVSYGTMGLQGAIRSSINNFTQLATIIGPTTGAIGGFAAAITAALLPAIQKAITYTEDLARATSQTATQAARRRQSAYGELPNYLRGPLSTEEAYQRIVAGEDSRLTLARTRNALSQDWATDFTGTAGRWFGGGLTSNTTGYSLESFGLNAGYGIGLLGRGVNNFFASLPNASRLGLQHSSNTLGMEGLLAERMGMSQLSQAEYGRLQTMLQGAGTGQFSGMNIAEQFISELNSARATVGLTVSPEAATALKEYIEAWLDAGTKDAVAQAEAAAAEDQLYQANRDRVARQQEDSQAAWRRELFSRQQGIGATLQNMYREAVSPEERRKLEIKDLANRFRAAGLDGDAIAGASRDLANFQTGIEADEERFAERRKAIAKMEPDRSISGTISSAEDAYRRIAMGAGSVKPTKDAQTLATEKLNADIEKWEKDKKAERKRLNDELARRIERAIEANPNLAVLAE